MPAKPFTSRGLWELQIWGGRGVSGFLLRHNRVTEAWGRPGPTARAGRGRGWLRSPAKAVAPQAAPRAPARLPAGSGRALPPRAREGGRARHSPPRLLRLQVFRMRLLLCHSAAPGRAFLTSHEHKELCKSQDSLPFPTPLPSAPNQRLFTQFEVSP